MCLQSGGRIIGGLFANEGFFFTFFWGEGGSYFQEGYFTDKIFLGEGGGVL